ncbi:MAG: tetratricopeptide repeat protein [Bacteroidetes bacterium]|nr:tetratricopeptide repeat protein [Bacteroidota bacterium]MDA0860336.1 tetratricopeptide repeat protein [Bacteroidota bacterium]MDA1318544.1 tetratricopeptide repeat protein [Bacteroidota bacterium]
MGLNSTAQIENDSLLKSITPPLEIQFQNYFYEGLKQKGIDNYNKAIDAFIKCAELFPERAVIFYELGDLYFKTKSYQRSESNLKRAIDLEANNFWFKEKLYHLYVHQNNYNKAIETVKSLLYKDKDYEEDLVNLYASAGQYDEAIAQIEILDKRYGYQEKRDQTRIEIYKRTQNQKGHIKFLKNRLKESPENEQNFLNLIFTLSQYNLKVDAFSTAKSFLKNHPKSHIAHVALYKFYMDAEDYNNAISSMKIVTSSNVLEPYLKVKVLSDFMRFVQKNPEYKEILLEVQPAESLDTSSRSNLEWGQYFLEQNKLDKALEFYEKVLEETPENLAVIKTVAKLYLKTKQYNKAVDFTTDQLELFPTQLELYLVYGTSQMALKQWNQALEMLEIGLDYIFEDNEVAVQYYNLIAELYKNQNNIKKSKAFSDKAKSMQLKL